MSQLEKDILLTKRNKIWLPKLAKILKKGDAFIAVGVAHMPGKAGLLKLLQKQGFKLQRGLSY